MKKQVSRQVALVAGAVLALSACSGTGSSTQSDDASQGGYDPEKRSSLSDAFDAIWGGGEWDEDQAAREQREAEELTAQCMSEQGFEYIPVDYSGVDWGWAGPGIEEDPDEPEWGSVAFAEKYGYQITYWELNQEDFEGEVIDPGIGVDNEYVDPNQAIVEAMSESEQQAYYVALSGPSSAWSDEEWEDYSNNFDDMGNWLGEGEDPLLNQGGCQNEAWNSIGNNDQWVDMQEDPDYLEFEELLNEFYESQSDDSAMTELNAEWSACMAESGYTYVEPWKAQEELYAEWDEMQADRWAAMDEIDWEDPNADDLWEDIYSQPIPGIDEFADKEYAIAIADAKCAAKIDYYSKQQDMSIELENEFYNANKTLIDEITARYGAE